MWINILFTLVIINSTLNMFGALLNPFPVDANCQFMVSRLPSLSLVPIQMTYI